MHFNRIFLCLFLSLSLFFCGCASTRAPMAAEVAAKPAAGESFWDELVFLGDSTTAHMLSRAPLRDGANSKQIWAAKNRYLNLDSRITYARIVLPESGEEMTVAEAAARVRPPYLVITLGIDYGVYYYREDLGKFRFYYEKLLDAVKEASPDTVPILQSIFPVARESAVITNEMIDRANSVIAAIAEDRGLVYVDAAARLKDAEGFLNPAYCSSADGIHLTAEAYRVILQNLAEYEERIKEKK